MSFYSARQPILNRDKTLFAYELLFRQTLENIFPQINEDLATAKLIEGLQFNLGLETLTQGTLAFINFSHETLLAGYPLLLDKEQIVVEILETAKPNKQLLNACIKLKEKGYMLALDDYEHEPMWRHFFPYIDIIKIDYLFSSAEQITQIINEVKDFPHIKLLAEKIETYSAYQHAMEIGCDYFQGYFFSKPEVIKTIALSPSQLSIVNLMSEINKNTPDLKKIAVIFENDVELSYKLLRYAQSPVFKRVGKLETLMQAITMFGIEELRRFISLLFAVQFSQGKPQELTVMALARARFCEVMVSSNKNHDQSSSKPSSAFLVGLLSLLDAMVDADITELLDKLPLSPDIKNALIKKQGEHAHYLRLCEIFELVLWPEGDALCAYYGYSVEQTNEHFQHALQWASQRVKMI